MMNFLKGIVVGVGGITPGLSGSVLLVIFGLYQKTIDAVGNLFKDFKKNLLFLIPLVLGMGLGLVGFSVVADFFLENYEMQTRVFFLGLVIGTLPLFYKEVKKEGFSKKYYIYMAVAAAAGLSLLFFGQNLFPAVEDPNFLQSMFLGVAVAGAFIVPGVDSAVILSSLGLYTLFVSSVASLDFSVLIPAGIGLVIAALVISFVMSRLLKHFYTATFSTIFGLFISIIPSVILEAEPETKSRWSHILTVEQDVGSYVLLIALFALGFVLSFYLGDIKKNNERIRTLFGKKAPKNED
ncbi:MAG: DUF368 domain-containing protein [Clostridia bacterium]|nr:DUF368 domain-containing protein [Clostridia bacterium]